MIISMTSKTSREAGPEHINPLQWHQSMGFARQACARIFRDGGSAADAVKAFGIRAEGVKDWSKAVELIAWQLAGTQARRAA